MALERIEAPVVEVEPTLEERKARLNRAHGLAEQHFRSGLEQALIAGNELLAIRREVSKGWVAWLDANFDGSRNSAYVYMNLVLAGDEIVNASSIQEAKKLMSRTRLRDEPRLRSGHAWRRFPEWMRIEARRLRQEGLSHEQIGDALGVSAGAVNRWLNPAAVKRSEAQLRVRRRRAKAAQAALKREESYRAVRAKGGDIAIAHEHLLKTEQALGRARTDLNLSADARAEIDEGFRDLNRLHDHIVRASRLS